MQEIEQKHKVDFIFFNGVQNHLWSFITKQFPHTIVCHRDWNGTLTERHQRDLTDTQTADDHLAAHPTAPSPPFPPSPIQDHNDQWLCHTRGQNMGIYAPVVLCQFTAWVLTCSSCICIRRLSMAPHLYRQPCFATRLQFITKALSFPISHHKGLWRKAELQTSIQKICVIIIIIIIKMTLGKIYGSSFVYYQLLFTLTYGKNMPSGLELYQCAQSATKAGLMP